MASRNIGFVSTRFAGTDGVSLESAKWAQLLWDHEHVSYWYAGKLDRDPDISMEVPEAYFAHPDVAWINERSFGVLTRSPELTRKIYDLSEYLKGTLYEFVSKYSIDILIAQNALCIPMNIPLGVALTNFIAETEFPTIGHHHDFYWERDRFAVNAVGDFLEMAFPPMLPSVQHATINTAAQQALARRKGASSILVPNVLQFEEPPEEMDEYSVDFREAIGIAADDILVLQPTRVVPRKGIERAIELVAQLKDPRCKLVVTHESGDEGVEYEHAMRQLAEESGVDVRFVYARVGDIRSTGEDGEKKYSLWDVYPHADLVTYLSTYEGFGNALIEAFYYRKPVVVNRYSIFISDIEPKDFEVITVPGYLTSEVTQRVKRVLSDTEYHDRMVNHNYEVAKTFYSYTVLRRKIRALVCNFTGEDEL